jgi:integrase/recombinase XerD
MSAKTPAGKKRLPVGIYLRGDTLWGRAQIGGREYRRSLRTADPKEAKLRFDDWHTELCRLADGGQETFKDAVVKWAREVLPAAVKPAVMRRYLASIAMLDATFGELRLIEITKRTIANYVSSRSGAVTNATIRRDLTALSRLLSCCVAWGWLEDSPMATFDRSLVAEQKRVFEPPTTEEFATLIRYVPTGMAGILRFLDQTGCRMDEAVSLQRRAIDWEAKTITLLKTKTTPRAIPFRTISGDVTGILAAAVPHVQSPFVFRTRENNRNLPPRAALRPAGRVVSLRS